MASLSLPFSLESASSTSDLKINGGLCLCAVNQNRGLPGLSVPCGVTSCLSDHLAMRELLRRERLSNQLTPNSSFFSQNIIVYLSTYSKFTFHLLSQIMFSTPCHFLPVSFPLLQSIFPSSPLLSIPLLILRVSLQTQLRQSLAQGHLDISC